MQLFCVSVCKKKIADHHMPNIIECFSDSVLICKMHDCILCKSVEHFHSFPSSDASDYKISRLDESKPLQNKCF